MHKDQIAESLLSLVTSRERALSTVGDFMEVGAARGAVWFWSGILRTAASLVWSGFSVNPANMAVLAFRGWLLVQVLELLLMVCVIVISMFYGAAWGMLSSRHAFQVGGLVRGVLNAVLWCGQMFCQFQVGRWIAARSRGRELSACLAVIIVQWILDGVIGLGIDLAFGNSAWLQDLRSIVPSVDMTLACFVGGLWVRRRASPDNDLAQVG